VAAAVVMVLDNLQITARPVPFAQLAYTAVAAASLLLTVVTVDLLEKMYFCNVSFAYCYGTW